MSSLHKLVVATRNMGKAQEFAAILGKLGIQLLTLNDFPQAPEIVEDGTTFQENAFKKAFVIARHLGMPVLADDSGLCVDALGGEPGVYSGRYAGEQAGDAENNRKLLAELAKRKLPADEHGCVSDAAFVCSLALVDPGEGKTIFAEGILKGRITMKPQGTAGFGYDPLFFVPALQKTLAELSLAEKNAISHRSQALKQLSSELDKRI